MTFVSAMGPDHYIVCAEPPKKIELGALGWQMEWASDSGGSADTGKGIDVAQMQRTVCYRRQDSEVQW